jgi:hypothetical protein
MAGDLLAQRGTIPEVLDDPLVTTDPIGSDPAGPCSPTPGTG